MYVTQGYFTLDVDSEGILKGISCSGMLMPSLKNLSAVEHVVFCSTCMYTGKVCTTLTLSSLPHHIHNADTPYA